MAFQMIEEAIDRLPELSGIWNRIWNEPWYAKLALVFYFTLLLVRAICLGHILSTLGPVIKPSPFRYLLYYVIIPYLADCGLPLGLAWNPSMLDLWPIISLVRELFGWQYTWWTSRARQQPVPADNDNDNDDAEGPPAVQEGSLPAEVRPRATEDSSRDVDNGKLPALRPPRTPPKPLDSLPVRTDEAVRDETRNWLSLAGLRSSPCVDHEGSES
ncbi:hypothetical protein QBC39DRAFT_373467 [Podospora conica]|nr:hypothetical protein QBC39DRAFT_373467 [Schizothecium conicum]